MKRVAVSQGVVFGMGAGLLACLLLLVFLLGRESARREPAALPVPGVSVPVPRTAAAPSTAPSVEAPAPSEATSLAAPDLPPPDPAGGLPLPVYEPRVPSPSGAPTSDPMRALVVSYFGSIDQLQPGQLGGDPSEVANKIVEAIGKGDTRGLDELVQKMESAKRGLEALNPPGPCALHHRESLAGAEEGLRMLRSMKKSIAASDVEALSKLSSQGEAMRTRSAVLAREEQALRQRYGLPRP